MKKIIIPLLAVVALAGCGTNEKTTCTNKNTIGNITSNISYEIEHKNKEVKKLTVTYDYQSSKKDIDVDNNNTTDTTDTTEKDEVIGGKTSEVLDDVVTGIKDGILDIAGVKEAHNTKFSTYKNTEGFKAKVDVDNDNDYKVEYTYDLTKLSDQDINSLGLSRNYDTLYTTYTNNGLICK